MLGEKKICVLIVDDSLVSRRFIKSYLKKMGITTVFEASNMKKGLERLKDRRFDLILSDWNMPGQSGLGLLKSVRTDSELQDIPFVMITAEGLKRNISEAFEAGVSGYILKPYDFETFKNEIGRIISQGNCGKERQ